MYAQIYNHPKNLSATWVLEQIFRRARELLKRDELEADETVTDWLLLPMAEISIERYLEGDDGVFCYHVQRWQKHPDAILSDFSDRFINRRLLKVLDVTYATTEEQENLLTNVQQQLIAEGVEAHRYSGLRRTWSKGYTAYHEGIKIKTPQGLKEINQISPLVQTLSQSAQRTWLIYPSEVVIGLCPLFIHSTDM